MGRAAAAALALVGAAPSLAQEIVASPTPTADALAAQVRILAETPDNLAALLTAGALATRLGDGAAATGFFLRATTIAPADPRVAAGRAGALVLLERPGEALAFYAQAERAGLAMTPYLTQRGLAYDLIGQPAYAQRDYRRALAANGRDDETVRRLALSLGIAGKGDEAIALLDPLIRRSDRAAWRARAFVLAMAGDAGDAERIASDMMPGGAALAPFFRRLRWLSLADRAFAVHFGDPTPSATRTADARLAPALALLPPEASPLPPVATVPRPAVVADNRRRTRTRPGREPIAAAAIPDRVPTSAPPVQIARAETAQPPPHAIVAPPLQRTTPSPGWAVTAETPPPAPAVATVPPPRAIEPKPPVAAPAPPVERPAPVKRRIANEALLAAIVAQISVPEDELVERPRPVTRAAVPVPDTPPARKPEPKPARPDSARTDPARWWVQVAGGSRAADLGREWARLAAKSPTAFRGRSAWTTPLRATNRLLAGPFKSQGEAATFVNALARDGIPVFAWQSEAGQKIDKLATK